MTTRKYTSIWSRIKESKEHRCTVEVHPAMVARVKKAVIKEKSQDLGFKLLNEDDYFFLRIAVDRSKPLWKITFTLKARLGLETIKT